jgi:hypothetical protein
MRTIALAAALVTLTGCGSLTPSPSATAPPDFVGRLDAGGSMVRRLLVYDTSGLLVNIQVPTHPSPFNHDTWWKPVIGDADSLTLGWLGGRCGIDPTLRVTTNGVTNQGTLVSLAVFDGHMPALASNEVCADVGIAYEVTLTFRQPISSLHISVALSEEPE